MPIGVTIIYAIMISTAIILLFCGRKSPKITFFWAGILFFASCLGLISDFYGKEALCNYIQTHWTDASWFTWALFSMPLFAVLVMLYKEILTGRSSRRFLDYMSFIFKKKDAIRVIVKETVGDEVTEEVYTVSVKDGKVTVVEKDGIFTFTF